MLGFEVRDPPLGVEMEEMDVWLPAVVGHFRKLSDDEKDEAGKAVSSETGLRGVGVGAGGGMISGRHAPLPGALPRLNVLHFAWLSPQPYGAEISFLFWTWGN